MKPGPYIIFELERELFGIPAKTIQGIVDAKRISVPILKTPNFLGSVLFKGSVIPVIDTRAVIGLRQKKAENILIVQGHDQLFGLAVDFLIGTVELNESDLVAAGQTGFYVSKLNGKAILLFLPNLVIPERVVLEAMAAAA